MNVIGMSWCKNEGDILEEVLIDASKKVDELYVADGHSTDRSWEILQSLKARGIVAHIQREDESNDRAQRTSLLNLIRKRYRVEDTLVQTIESDIFLLDTDVRAAWRDYATADVGMGWQMINGCRRPGEWAGVDEYPNWSRPIREVMTHAHETEVMLYTYRPLPGLYFDPWNWRPWPLGFSQYTREPVDKRPKGPNAPLLLHVGFRGPTHFHLKYKHMGKHHTRYPNWRVDSPANVERTVAFFNGQWNGRSFVSSREGWLGSTKWSEFPQSTPPPI